MSLISFDTRWVNNEHQSKLLILKGLNYPDDSANPQGFV